MIGVELRSTIDRGEAKRTCCGNALYKAESKSEQTK